MIKEKYGDILAVTPNISHWDEIIKPKDIHDIGRLEEYIFEIAIKTHCDSLYVQEKLFFE